MRRRPRRRTRRRVGKPPEDPAALHPISGGSPVDRGILDLSLPLRLHAPERAVPEGRDPLEEVAGEAPAAAANGSRPRHAPLVVAGEARAAILPYGSLPERGPRAPTQVGPEALSLGAKVVRGEVDAPSDGSGFAPVENNALMFVGVLVKK